MNACNLPHQQNPKPAHHSAPPRPLSPFPLCPPAVLYALALALSLGCSRAKKSDDSAPPATPPATAPALATPATDVAPPPPPPPAPEAATGDAPPGEPPPSIAQLNQALGQWVFQHNNPPKDLNELVKEGYLKRLPTPPPGKRFSFDPSTMKVVISD